MSQFTRRGALAAGALAGIAPLARPALGQGNYPSRPVQVIVPWGAGGGTDATARIVASLLEKEMGQPFNVVNRTGGSGVVGHSAIAQAAPDGYTIGMGQAANLAINPALYPRMPFDPLTDFALISLVATQPNVLVVARGAPYRTVADLVAAGKARPGTLTAGNAGNGTTGHLAAAMFAQAAGIEVVHVPYRGAAPVITDLLAGRVDMFFANPLAVKGMLESGDVRALAVTSAERSRTFPTVPTVAESGYPDFEAVNWTGLVAPARTPDAIIARLNEETRKALALPETIARLAAEGSEPFASSPERFRTFLVEEHAKWGRVVREARIELN